MSIVIRREMDILAIRQALENLPSGKKIRTARHCGVIQLPIDPLVFQKQMRDEWE